MTGVSWELLDPEERTVPRDLKEDLVSLETLDHLDQQERRVNSVSLGCQVILDGKVLRVLKASKDSREPTERRAQGEQQESLAQEDNVDLLVLVERGDQGDQQEKQDQRATQEAMDPQDLPVKGV